MPFTSDKAGGVFKHRIKEHINAITKKTPNTGFTDHCLKLNHEFNGEFKILHTCQKGLKMNCLENIEIRKAVHSKKNIVNEQTDVSSSPLINCI